MFRFKNVITPGCHGKWVKTAVYDKCPCQGINVLMYLCNHVLMYSCTSCTHVRVYSFTYVLMYSCTPFKGRTSSLSRAQQPIQVMRGNWQVSVALYCSNIPQVKVSDCPLHVVYFMSIFGLLGPLGSVMT